MKGAEVNELDPKLAKDMQMQGHRRTTVRFAVSYRGLSIIPTLHKYPSAPCLQTPWEYSEYRAETQPDCRKVGGNVDIIGKIEALKALLYDPYDCVRTQHGGSQQKRTCMSRRILGFVEMRTGTWFTVGLQ